MINKKLAIVYPLMILETLTRGFPISICNEYD